MFRASRLEFRLRYLTHTVVYVLGFLAPWNYWLHLDPVGANSRIWGLLAVNVSQTRVMSIVDAFEWLLIVAILFAAAGAWLRTWGSAYLGASVVADGTMHTATPTGGILTDGPFRRMRNPLYVGTFLHSVALALLMPRTGAIFMLIAIAVMQSRLILGEEAFLAAKLGPPYAAYCALVPRILPTLRPRAVATGRTPRWLQACLGESYMILVAVAFAVLGWRYNAVLLMQAVLVAFGLSLVLRAVAPKNEAMQ